MSTTVDSAPASTVMRPGSSRLTLGQVRQAFSPVCYQRSPVRAIAALVLDLGLYVAFVVAALVAPHPLLSLGAAVLAGFAVAFAFVWGHDAAHGALFASERTSEVLGTLAMLPSLNMYRLWVFGHNKVHHGFTSLSVIDWIWRPWSAEEYREASRTARLVYRLERMPATCVLHYLLRVWWPGMVRFRPDPRARPIAGVRASKFASAGFALALGAVGWWVAGPLVGVMIVVVPFLVFTWFISFFVYLHHTHPDVAFWDDRRRWSALDGQLRSSITIRTNPVWEHLTHNILVHTPHHVDTRIPFYRLPRAVEDLGAEYASEMTTYRFRWRTVRHIFATCKVYDYDAQRWEPYPEVSAQS